MLLFMVILHSNSIPTLNFVPEPLFYGPMP